MACRIFVHRWLFFESFAHGMHGQVGPLYGRYEQIVMEHYVRLGRMHLHLYRHGYRGQPWRVGRRALGGVWWIQTPWFSFVPWGTA